MHRHSTIAASMAVSLKDGLTCRTTVRSVSVRCHETLHRPHRRQIQVLGIGKMCLARCILLISIKKRNRLRLHF